MVYVHYPTESNIQLFIEKYSKSLLKSLSYLCKFKLNQCTRTNQKTSTQHNTNTRKNDVKPSRFQLRLFTRQTATAGLLSLYTLHCLSLFLPYRTLSLSTYCFLVTVVQQMQYRMRMQLQYQTQHRLRLLQTDSQSLYLPCRTLLLTTLN